MPDAVRLERAAPHVQVLRFTRPQVLNALDDDAVAQLHSALDTIAHDDTCRVVVLTGEGRAFCSGFDLRHAYQAPGQETLGEAAAWMKRQEAFSRLISRMRELRQPVIAAVNGAATGGGFALALAADLRVAAESARFGAVFIRVGMSGCDMGVSWLLQRSVGMANAARMLFTGELIGAGEALRTGLVSHTVPDDQLNDEAVRLAESIAAHDPFGIWMTKRGHWANAEAGSLQAAMELENRTQMLSRTTGGLADAARKFSRT